MTHFDNNVKRENLKEKKTTNFRQKQKEITKEETELDGLKTNS